MNATDFTNTQKTHYTVYPKVKRRKLESSSSIPFVKLFDGEEPENIVFQRWELYHQLYNQFHLEVDKILDEIETDVYGNIPTAITKALELTKGKHFSSLCLLGADGSTKVEAPNDSSNYMNILVDLTPKESPNLRMILRRSMFKLHSSAEAKMLDGSKDEALDIDEFHSDKELEPNDAVEVDGILYDLSMIEAFYKRYNKKLNLIINFRDVDSFYFQVLEDFIWLLKSTLENEEVNVCFVFNINTNISNFEKNLKQRTVRLLKKNFHTIDLSHNKGHRYENRVFQSFLNTVDGKLNLSPRFVKFILDKMSNKSSQNIQLLIKILDYSLMSYFYQNPYSIFIDLTNMHHFDDKYVRSLIKCNTFMTFIEGMIREHAPSSDILSLLENRNKALEEFFAEFLVRDNPVNRHLNFAVDLLENRLGISDFDVVELYYHLLIGKLDEFLEKWPQCQQCKEELKFEPIAIVFQELFTLDNNNGLLTQALFPFLRSNMEDNLLNCERMFPPSLDITDGVKKVELELNKLLDVPICHLFKLYREANAVINVYDFFTAFKESLPQEKIVNTLRQGIKSGELHFPEESKNKLLSGILKLSDSEAFDKIALFWFIQSVSECQYIGIFRTHQYKSYEAIEKIIWRGI
ncbi:HHR006Cp [Eremothecium sinecaudum]|uniref:HHR006Cp n=1 Tax=Eremothecium sinecaudum TaxID=45286 RepID=A0A0X8HWM0_9SACH|nr:HHR006Cp [Eremothecium sinecaudum]AMD22775.1 HHR006Cp [Eremothecium sinecaudum]